MDSNSSESDMNDSSQTNSSESDGISSDVEEVVVLESAEGM